MTDYQRIILSGPTIDGEPGLPSSLAGLSEESLADLSAALDPCPAEFEGIGYWPIQPAEPTPVYRRAVRNETSSRQGQPEKLSDGCNLQAEPRQHDDRPRNITITGLPLAHGTTALHAD